VPDSPIARFERFLGASTPQRDGVFLRDTSFPGTSVDVRFTGSTYSMIFQRPADHTFREFVYDTHSSFAKDELGIVGRAGSSRQHFYREIVELLSFASILDAKAGAWTDVVDSPPTTCYAMRSADPNLNKACFANVDGHLTSATLREGLSDHVITIDSYARISNGRRIVAGWAIDGVVQVSNPRVCENGKTYEDARHAFDKTASSKIAVSNDFTITADQVPILYGTMNGLKVSLRLDTGNNALTMNESMFSKLYSHALSEVAFGEFGPEITLDFGKGKAAIRPRFSGKLSATDGEIGYPILHDKIVIFDYVAKRGQFVDALPARFKDAVAVDLDLWRGGLYVDATIEKRASGRLLLDSGRIGTQSISVTRRLADGLPKDLSRRLDVTDRRGTLRIPCGRDVELIIGVGISLGRVTACLSPARSIANSDGEIPLSLLATYEIALDYPHMKLYLLPRASVGTSVIDYQRRVGRTISALPIRRRK
jgi:hypothetical protein